MEFVSAKLPCPGEPTVLWLKMFQNMLVINATGDSWPETREQDFMEKKKKNQRLFYTLPNTDDLADAIKTSLQKEMRCKNMQSENMCREMINISAIHCCFERLGYCL